MLKFKRKFRRQRVKLPKCMTSVRWAQLRTMCYSRKRDCWRKPKNFMKRSTGNIWTNPDMCWPCTDPYSVSHQPRQITFIYISNNKSGIGIGSSILLLLQSALQPLVGFGLLYDFVPQSSIFTLLSLSLQFLTFIFFRSSSTWSSHLSLGLPTGLDEHGSHSVRF